MSLLSTCLLSVGLSQNLDLSSWDPGLRRSLAWFSAWLPCCPSDPYPSTALPGCLSPPAPPGPSQCGQRQGLDAAAGGPAWDTGQGQCPWGSVGGDSPSPGAAQDPTLTRKHPPPQRHRVPGCQGLPAARPACRATGGTLTGRSEAPQMEKDGSLEREPRSITGSRAEGVWGRRPQG